MIIILNRIVYNFFVDGEAVRVECKEEKTSFRQNITNRYYTVTTHDKEPIMYCTANRISKKQAITALKAACYVWESKK